MNFEELVKRLEKLEENKTVFNQEVQEVINRMYGVDYIKASIYFENNFEDKNNWFED